MDIDLKLGYYCSIARFVVPKGRRRVMNKDGKSCLLLKIVHTIDQTSCLFVSHGSTLVEELSKSDLNK